MLDKELERLICFNDEHIERTYITIELTDFGISIVFNDEHPAKV